MNVKSVILIFFAGILLTNCNDRWNAYYDTDVSFVDHTIWHELNTNPDYSSFRDYVEEFGLENYFINSDSMISVKTVFIPDNDAFSKIAGTENEITGDLILYHLINSQFLLSNIHGSRKSQTQNSKFLYFEEYDNYYTVDGIEVSAFQNRYVDGIIYPLDQVLLPKPSIAEYIKANAEYFGNYIASFDTLIMDYSNSEIIEIDYENDEVIYDSVYTVYNAFKAKYFDIDRNTRDTFATLLLYTDQQFDQALNQVAADIGYEYGTNLPYKWIREVYFNHYLKTAFFKGLYTYEELSANVMININGDTVEIDYDNLLPEKVICSNGLIYLYKNLEIPESLYKSEAATEGEHVVEKDINGKLKFVDEVITEYTNSDGKLLSLEGNINYILGASGIASNDSAIQVTLGPNFNGKFVLEIPVKNVFPGRYILEWAGFSTVSGIFKVYANDSLLHTRLPFKPDSDPGSLISEFDSYNFGSFTLKDLPSHEDGIDWSNLRATNQSWNINEFYVERNPSDSTEYYLTEYGDVRIKFEFIAVSESNSSNVGITIDHLKMTKR